MHVRIITLITPLLMTERLTAAAPADVLTLDQAIAAALEDNRSIRNAALEVQKAEYKVAAARTGYPASTFTR
jgi:outer membrane protein TolC